MKQVIQSRRNGNLTLRDVPAPQVKPGQVLVRTRASLISAGTERMVMEFAQKNLVGKAKARPELVKKVFEKARRDGITATFQSVMARLDEPLPLGYSAAGEITAIGSGLEGIYATGQRVAVAGAGIANHAEVNAVPKNLLAPIPKNVSYEAASFATLGAIAIHAVRNLGSSLGDIVAVIGCGLVGQLVSQFLALSGVRVIALDYDANRLDLAQSLGAEMVFNLADSGLETSVREISSGKGCDGIIIAAATQTNEPFVTAAMLARDRARVVMVGLTGTSFPYGEFMKKELNIIVSRSYGPGRYDPDFENHGIKYPEGWVRWTEKENLAETLRLISTNRLDVEALITHRFSINEAESAYKVISGDQNEHLGVILNYPQDRRLLASPHFPRGAANVHGCIIGLIGAGNYARSVLLPILKNIKNVQLHTLVTHHGASAEQSRANYGFGFASTDPEVIFQDTAINTVIVATRHGSHADLVARALNAGKNVLCEKPLTLDWEGLNTVITARNASKTTFFQIGFNRRFAPASTRLRDGLTRKIGPKIIQMRINVGNIDAQHWVHDPREGGGRLLGEACHFVDLARFLIGTSIVSVSSIAAKVTDGACDDAAIALQFADGSIADILYTARGNTGVSKERIEAHAEGASYLIDDFRSLTVSGDKATIPWKGPQDKGIKDSLAAFFSGVATGSLPPVDEAELIETSAATIAVLDSLRTGERVHL